MTENCKLTLTDLRDGDVLTWRPTNRHAREGTAVVSMREDGRLIVADTYWGSGNGNHVPSAAEIATGAVEWNLNDFEPLDRNRHASWGDYDPDDRRSIRPRADQWHLSVLQSRSRRRGHQRSRAQ